MSKIGDYKFHPAANIFPMMAGEEWAAFEADVEAHGFREKVTFWKNAKGEKLYIDGRNRVQAAVNIRKKNAEFPLPEEEEYKGAESGVLDFVLSKNLHGRRHLKSGQIAAAAAEAGYLMNLYARREKGTIIADLGDLATYLAKRLQTNRTYLYKTMRLRDARPDLLSLIKLGSLNIPQAEKRWKEEAAEERRLNGETSATITDGLGNPADPRFEEEFAARGQFDEVMKLIRQAKGGVKALASMEAGADWFDSKEAQAAVENLESLVHAAYPHAVCPACMGARKVQDGAGTKRKVRCQACEGHGYVNEARFNNASAEAANLTPVEDDATPADDAPAADATEAAPAE
jgi:hypothetical protein